MQLTLAPSIWEARDTGQPLVALESTVISHGLAYPHNLAVAHAMQAAVRAGGAVPATIGIVAGRPVIGLDDDQLALFAQQRSIRKVSRRDIAATVAAGEHGATTVAATMALAHAAGISVFATGGIGGVHRGATQTWDVSADLTELARTPVLVVCAGAKAILDLPATLEYLETLSVPVVGYQTDDLPAFYSRSSGLPLSVRVDSPADAAHHWQTQRACAAYGAAGGMLLCVPPPADVALDTATVEAALARALAAADVAGVRGAAVTPYLLAAMARETAGESVTVNRALLQQNATIAAQVAAALPSSGETLT